MKFSEAWLRTWTNPEIDTDTLCHQLTMAGLEVESIEPAALPLQGVVVAQILELTPHPDAEKLRVCQVDAGAEKVQIVCGAPNAAVGLKVPCALVGAVLPGEFKIKQAKLRGVESNGMLCGADEIGFESNVDGLWVLPVDAPVGTKFADWLQLDDQIIEVDLTPNRADCLSVLGIAREVALLNGSPAVEAPKPLVEVSSKAEIPVEIQAGAACPRYLARIVEGVDLNIPSPIWMQERLRRSGIRSIGAAVDVTNYVMLELGQPLHAFDLDLLQGSVKIRMAENAEKITLLDGKTVELQSDVLVIADERKALAIAGIMGGEGSGVSAQTKNILLESALFLPPGITGRARRFGLHTEASHRFERGVDPQLQELAIERATELLLQIVGGRAGPIIKRESEQHIPKSDVILLRKSRVQQLLGVEYSSSEIEGILRGLGCSLKEAEGASWQVNPPSWRYDLQIEVDLIEEVARISGYSDIAGQPMPANLKLGKSPENRVNPAVLLDQMVARGFREVITYSFISADLADQIIGKSAQVPVQNPLGADMSVMRPSLIPGLLTSAAYNLARQESRVRIFESGAIFIRTQDLQQPEMFAALISGTALPENWTNQPDPVDFFQLKGELDALASLTGKSLTFAPTKDIGYLHPGRSADVLLGNTKIGVIGAVHPQILRSLDIDTPTYVFEIETQPLLHCEVPGFVALSKYPAVRRDLAVLIDRNVSSDSLIREIKEAGSSLLTNIRLFDIYTGQGIDSNKKSVAVGLTFRDSSRTLREEEISLAVAGIVARLEQKLDAKQR